MFNSISATLRSPLISVSTLALCVSGSVLATSQPIQAQQSPNIGGVPIYGTFYLDAGFSPDPYRVEVQAGGSSDVWQMDLGNSCAGYIAAGQPDVRVNYQSGSLPLAFQVESNTDTTLIINGPDGRWYCNDDANGFNPEVAFSSPSSGQYDVWVGTFQNGPTRSATLSVTELIETEPEPFLPSLYLPDISASPRYGTVNLSAGFIPDPRSIDLRAGGTYDASDFDLGNSCVGYIAAGQPDVRVNYQAGSWPLSFQVESDADTTLLINGPDGRWYCNDDMNSLNPEVIFNAPSSGQYDIWVGTYRDESTRAATLDITELSPNSPQGNVPNFNGIPLYGTYDLNAGFLPDPYEVDVMAGGSSDLWDTDLGNRCSGYIAADQPDVRLNYSATSFWSLTIQAFADTDTTLLIHTPDGRWYCNDDANDLNPAVSFESPMSGQYDIWVGTFLEGSPQSAMLEFTEW